MTSPVLLRWLVLVLSLTSLLAADLRVATFDVDATPPIGSRMASDPVTNAWDLGLRARGIVLIGAGRPIVLCAVDWLGIANEGHDAFCRTLAGAADTTPDQVDITAIAINKYFFKCLLLNFR